MSTATKTDPTAGIFADLDRAGAPGRNNRRAVELLADAGLADRVAPQVAAVADADEAWQAARAAAVTFTELQGIRGATLRNVTAYWRNVPAEKHAPEVHAEAARLANHEYLTEQARDQAQKALTAEIAAVAASPQGQAAARPLILEAGAAADAHLNAAVEQAHTAYELARLFGRPQGDSRRVNMSRRVTGDGTDTVVRDWEQAVRTLWTVEA